MNSKTKLKNICNQKLFTASTLCKWLPREKSAKKSIAIDLINYFGWTPKFYRKIISSFTDVVEQKMCKGMWDDINFSSVPSLAASRYKKCFNRHTEKYAEYIFKLVSGDKSVSVAAGAIYPYDVIKGVGNLDWKPYTKTEQDLIIEQWKALPNFVGDASILPLVDVSGSMTTFAGNNQNLTCMDIAVSLGLYLAEKNVGEFKDVFLTFSAKPKLVHLRGNIIQKIQQMVKSDWGMNTNLHAAVKLILKTAIDGNVPQEEMPKLLLVLSDMQFDFCVQDSSLNAMNMIKQEYEQHGYTMPKIVFWNLNSYDNVPVKFNDTGVALVSGFSPAIVKSILSNDSLDNFTPEKIMLNTIMNERYSWNN